MLTPIQRSSSLKEEAYQRIKAAIIANELKPGQQLKEERLAAQLGISATPLREALAKLEQEWLVQIAPHQGRFVTEITAELVKDIFEVRRELEGLAIELATPSLAQNDLEELERLLQVTEARIEQGNDEPSSYFESDSRLYELIVQNAGNQWVVRLLRTLNDHLRRIRAFSVARPGAHIQQSFREHLAILEALKARDATKAKQLMEEHVQKACERIIELLDEDE
jgi:DNA-binding GntR family transcriptional regulator